MKNLKKIVLLVALAVFAFQTLAAGDRGKYGRDREDDEDVVYVPAWFSVVPGGNFGVKIGTSIAVGLIMSDVYRLDGVQGAPIMSIVGDETDGVQFAGVGNVTNGELHGFQAGGVFNITGDDVSGAQAAGVFNIARGDLSTAQVAGVFNIADSDANWLQWAGVFNVTSGRFRGLQSAGVFNIADGGVSGIQAAGVFNVAGDVNGAQVAGVVNVADTVRGVQIGLVNICDEMYGIPIGLVNIVRKGIFDLSAWKDETGYAWVGLQKGSSNFYMLAYGGEHTSDWFSNMNTYTAALGFGTRIKLGPIFIDLDGAAKHRIVGVEPGKKIYHSLNFYNGQVFPSFRAIAGLKLFGDIGVFGGITFDCHIPGYSGYDPVFHTGKAIDGSLGGVSFSLYPKWFFGLKI
jgi:hypothetical protein